MSIRDNRGSAMMEFVLSLPFLWLIITLCIGFAGGVLARHRAAVVVREHAFLDSSNAGTSEIEAESLGAVKLRGTFSSSPTGRRLDEAGLDKVLALLGRVSNAHKVCFEGSRDQNVSAF